MIEISKDFDQIEIDSPKIGGSSDTFNENQKRIPQQFRSEFEEISLITITKQPFDDANLFGSV
jgi:hypothetical protein